MEVTQSRPHMALLSALASPSLLVLVAYLTAVTVQLVLLTRSALMDDLFSIARKTTQQKRILGMAAVSLAATWYYMLSYLFWSYAAYLDRVQLTGGELPSIPSCKGGLRCGELVLTAKLMRASCWLRETSLFEEAWLHVVTGKLNWWWSLEICSFTVGFWALHTRLYGKRFMVPHVWAYMLLGQSVAISVAMQLFNLAVVTRAAPIQMAENVEPDSTTKGSPSIRRTYSAEQMPPPENTKPMGRSSYFYHVLSPPRYGDMALCTSMSLAGLTAVLLVPSDLLSILSMHLCPLLMVLPLRLPSTTIPRQWRPVLSNSSLYALIAAYSLILRVRSHWQVWPRLSHLPATFISHPAQSSISADYVCVTVSVMVELLLQAVDQVGSARIRLLFLALLTPVVGPSTAMSTFYAVTLRHSEQDHQKEIWAASDTNEALRGKDILLKTKVTTSSYAHSFTPSNDDPI